MARTAFIPSRATASNLLLGDGPEPELAPKKAIPEHTNSSAPSGTACPGP